MGTVLDFFAQGRFVGAKPREEIKANDLKQINALQKTGWLDIQRKRDGYGTYVPISDRRVNLFSRLNTAWTGKFPSIEEELRSMNIPNETILCAETTATNKLGHDDPHLFGRFARTNRDGSILLQKGFAPVRMSLFDVLVHNGRDLSNETYENRLDILQNICARSTDRVSVVERVEHSFADAQDIVKRLQWEGIIVRDLRSKTAFRTDGNSADPPRPDGCWKWKPFQEADFVALRWIPSDSKKYKGLVRDLVIAQYDPRTGELVDWGVCGVGLSDEQKQRLTDDSLYPFVVQIKFELRTKNNRLQKASIMRIRDDKRPEECFYPPMPLAA